MGFMSVFKYRPSGERLFGFSRIIGAMDGKDTVYMTRLWIGRLRFHLFHRGDEDPDCHDHPWGFWTFPLRSYVEEYLVATVVMNQIVYKRELRVVKAFRLHYRPAIFKHRVLGVAAKPPWGPTMYHPVGLIPTIVWRTGSERAWGFTKEREGKWCWVPWRKYVYEGGKQAPCDE